MNIGGLQKSTLIDYPGHIACTVFLSGCNFRCPWCYSPEIVLSEKIKDKSIISSDSFFSFLDKRKGLLDGVVVCGGEPTINKELPNFLKEIKKRNFKIKLDTNGSNPLVIESLLKLNLLDYIAMDVKAPLRKEDYSRVAGVDIIIENIKDSIEIIKNSGIDYEFRTTIVPLFHRKEDIIEIAKQISPAEKYYLQNFRAEKNIDPKLTKIKPYSDSFIKEIREEVKGFFKFCETR